MAKKGESQELEIMPDTGTAIVPTTGEVISLTGYGEMAISLPTGQRAKARCDILRMDIEDRIAELTEGDELLANLRIGLADAESVVEAVQSLVSSAIPDDIRKAAGVGMKFSVGGVGITWAKPATTIKSKITLRTVWERAKAGDVDCKSIAEFMGLEESVSAPPAPSIRWGGAE